MQVNYKDIQFKKFKQGIDVLARYNPDGSVTLEELSTLKMRIPKPEDIEDVDLGMLYSKGWPEPEDNYFHIQVIPGD